MRAAIDHIVEHSPWLSTYYFLPENPFRFTPGEYTELYFPHEHADNRGESRKFSIASSPTERLLAIMVTFTPANGSSFKTALRSAKPGDYVQLSETMGDFVLPKITSIPLVFIAAGAGISPVLSMLKWMQDKNQRRDTHVIHSVSDEPTLLGTALFSKQASRYTPIVTKPSSTWQGQTERITAQRILQLTGESRGKRYYIAGPEAFAATIKHDLQALGIQPENILTDVFLGAPEIY